MQLPAASRRSSRRRAVLALVLAALGGSLVVLAFRRLGLPVAGARNASSKDPLALQLGSHASAVYSVAFTPPSSPDAADGELVLRATDAVGERPSWLCAHPTVLGRTYGTLERQGAEGVLVALQAERTWSGQPGPVKVVGEVPSRGRDPVHCTVTPDGSYLVAANYGSGSVVFHPLTPSGLFRAPPARQRSSPAAAGSSAGSFVHMLPPPDDDEDADWPHADRQASAHAHQVLTVGTDLWVIDLGNDCIWRLRRAGGPASRWSAGDEVDLERVVEGWQIGEGWRHAVVGPSGRDVYILTEFTLEILHYRVPLSQPPSLASRTPLLPARPASSTASGAELVLLPPSEGVPFGALLASTRETGALANADELLRVPLVKGGAVDGKAVGSLRPREGRTLRALGVSADGRFVFTAGQTDGALTAWGQDVRGAWHEVAPPLLGLDRPTSVLVL